MPNIRAFISSTMDDLGNERRAIAKRLRDINVEPVYAENFSPTGHGSWDVIQSELTRSHIFILLLTENYGWSPKDGPGGEQELSVTHMEYRAAREAGLVILPFVRRPRKIDAPSMSDDMKAFLKEVQDWKDGLFRGQFDWAEDLEREVSKAIGQVQSVAFFREFETQREQRRVEKAEKNVSGARTYHQVLTNASWVSSKAILIAGAGMSINAGYPNAAILGRILSQSLTEAKVPPPIDSDFEALANIFRSQFGATRLSEEIQKTFSSVVSPEPTLAHKAAVRIFKIILTSNYDDLFERACQIQGITYDVLRPGDNMFAKRKDETVLIIKVDGDVAMPSSLLMTDSPLQQFVDQLCNEKMSKSPFVIVGHSLRASILSPLVLNRINASGAFVTTETETTLAKRLSENGFEPILADADSFLISYEQALAFRS